MLRTRLHWTWISILSLGLAGACGDSTGEPDANSGPDCGVTCNEPVDAAGNIDAPESAIDGGTPGDDAASGTDAGLLPDHPILVEVYYDDPSPGQNGDNGKEWVKLFNPTSQPIDLAGYSLGWGGANYITGTLQLTGTIAAGGCFVVGGPDTNATNGNPIYSQTADLAPDLQNGGDQADGVALFETTVDLLEATTVPLDAVIYGADNNASGLLDPTGAVGEVDVPTGVDPGQSIRNLSNGIWEVHLTPTPNTCPPFPEASI